MRIFISGSITDNPNFKADFNAAENMLLSQGYQVINPAKLYLVANGLTWRQYMGLCKKLLRCADGIYMLNGFEKSRGAMIEYSRAHIYPNIKKIFFEEDGVPQRRWGGL